MNNISNKTLDKLKELYQNNKYYNIIERKSLSLGKKREYFLLAFNVDSTGDNRNNLEVTFIWISNNLWQYTFCNTKVTDNPIWINPQDLLTKLLKGNNPYQK